MDGHTQHFEIVLDGSRSRNACDLWRWI